MPNTAINAAMAARPAGVLLGTGATINGVAFARKVLVMVLTADWPSATVTLAGENAAVSQVYPAGAAGWASLKLQTAPLGTSGMVAVCLPGALKLVGAG